METLTHTGKRVKGVYDSMVGGPIGKKLKMSEALPLVDELPPVVVELPPVVVELPPVVEKVLEEKKVVESEEEDFNESLPGFVPKSKMKPPPKQAAPKKTLAEEVQDLVSRMPHHLLFDLDNITIRKADRKSMHAREEAEMDRHAWAMCVLKKESKILADTEETDKNILLLHKGEGAYERLTDKASIKARNIAKRAANKRALEAAKPPRPILRLKHREPQQPRWSRLSSLPQNGAKPRRRIPEAVEVPPADAQAEDDAISAEDVSGEDIEESDEGDYSGDESA